MQQVTVSGVDLHHFETGGQRALGGGDEVGDHLLDLRLVQRPGLRMVRVKGNPAEGPPAPSRRPAA